MSTLPLVDPDTATGAAAELFAAVQRRVWRHPEHDQGDGQQPRTPARRPRLSIAPGGGVLDGRPGSASPWRSPKTTPARTACRPTATSPSTSPTSTPTTSPPHERPTASDPTTAALLAFATAVNDQTRRHGPPPPSPTVRAAGASDEEIAETIGHVALNVLTNYFNKAAGVDLDFPVVTV